MCRRIPNLDTAIEICRQLGKKFSWERGKKHIKFYVDGRTIIISLKKDNPDRVRKDIKKYMA